MSDLLQQAVINYFAAVSALDVEAFVSSFAEDAAHFDPANSPGLHGTEAIRQFFLAISAGFETVHMQAESMFVVGAEVAVRWSATGQGKNGRAVQFEGIDVFTFQESGKIQKLVGYWNPAPVLAELQA
ncbi:MAG: nuclear transport factor 2 family protein [Blastocatellia bacterium]|nr:nuclear transport factor 2 family protein [Blastocatellia bacterium]